MILLGIIKSLVIGSNKLKGALETLFVGIIAAGASYLVGWLLEGIEDNNSI